MYRSTRATNNQTPLLAAQPRHAAQIADRRVALAIQCGEHVLHFTSSNEDPTLRGRLLRQAIASNDQRMDELRTLSTYMLLIHRHPRDSVAQNIRRAVLHKLHVDLMTALLGLEAQKGKDEEVLRRLDYLFEAYGTRYYDSRILP